MGTGSNDELAIRSFYFDQAEPVRLTLPYCMHVATHLRSLAGLAAH